MSNSDNHASLIRALEASGSEREAQLARAILGDPAAATPAEPVAPAPAAAAPTEASAPVPDAAAQPGPPHGRAPLTQADLATISQSEAVERMDEVDALLKAGS